MGRQGVQWANECRQERVRYDAAGYNKDVNGFSVRDVHAGCTHLHATRPLSKACGQSLENDDDDAVRTGRNWKRVRGSPHGYTRRRLMSPHASDTSQSPSVVPTASLHMTHIQTSQEYDKHASWKIYRNRSIKGT